VPKRLTLTLVALLTLTACGSSSSKPLDQAHLAKLNLALTDLPSDFTGTTNTDKVANAKRSADLSRCAGIRDTFPDQVAEARSLKFTSGPETVDTDVESYRTEADVTGDLSDLRSAKAQDCAVAQAKAEAASNLPTGAHLTAVKAAFTASPVPALKNIVEEGTITLTITLTITYKNKRITAYVNAYNVVGPRLEGNISFTQIGAPVSAETQTRLLTIFSKRLSKA
jgi:hypothetical protein